MSTFFANKYRVVQKLTGKSPLGEYKTLLNWEINMAHQNQTQSISQL